MQQKSSFCKLTSKLRLVSISKRQKKTKLMANWIRQEFILFYFFRNILLFFFFSDVHVKCLPLDKQGASEESWCHAQTNPRSCFWWIMTRLLGRCDSTPGDVSGDTGTFSESRRKSPAFKSDSFCRQYLKTKILRARPCRFIKALLAGSAARKPGGGI